VAYATDKAGTLAVFALSGQVYAAPLNDPAQAPRLIVTQTPALDPRPDPTGTRVAYVHDGALRVVHLATGQDTIVAQEAKEGEEGGGTFGVTFGVTFGLAEFVAAEEMGRSRGYWWSPDGTRLLIARVDETGVKRWHIADPANPDRRPAEVGYPAAGTANADVSLFVATLAAAADDDDADADADDHAADDHAKLASVGWDRAAFPYLVTATWGDDLLIVVQSRDQKTMRLINAATGEVLREDSDPHWTDVIVGVPAQLGNGDIVWTGISDDTRGLVISPAAGLADARPLTPPGLQVLAVLGTEDGDVLFAGATEPTEIGVWRYGPSGLAEVATEPGVHAATSAGGTTVTASLTLASNGPSVTVRRSTGATGEAVSIPSLAQSPHLPHPEPRFLSAGPAGIRTAVLFPSWHKPGARLPVLMDPYGGPHHQRVMKATGPFLASQWLAEQGFAVVVADGRGTGGRGPAWDRAVAGDLATGPLEDQITALGAAAEAFADLDTDHVAIRGWSFGGYLAALAVLRRPDVFHAAVAGAPVTDWRLYDTHYTERYLGDPVRDSAAYEKSSTIGDPERTGPALARPLLIIHGLADDNVFVAHSLRLSSALLAAGYPHQVLPLSGVTHMTPQEVVAENLLLLQVEFLRQALGLQAPPTT
jgi:dipeptidyl-peptidase-4